MTQEREACLLTLSYVKPHPGQLSAAKKGHFSCLKAALFLDNFDTFLAWEKCSWKP